MNEMIGQALEAVNLDHAGNIWLAILSLFIAGDKAMYLKKRKDPQEVEINLAPLEKLLEQRREGEIKLHEKLNSVSNTCVKIETHIEDQGRRLDRIENKVFNGDT